VFDDDEPFDLEPLQISDEEMHEAQPKPEAEAAMEDEVGDDKAEFQNPFEGHPNPGVFLGGPSDKSVLSEYGGHIARCIYENFVNDLIL
jgi:hypothetical protein